MTQNREPAVLLVSMPWTVLGSPSLGLGLLRAVLDQRAIPCKVRHLSLFMLEHLKATTYEDIADAYALNDFLFSGYIEPGTTNAQLRSLRERVATLLCQGKFDPHRYGGSEGVIDMLLHMRSVVIPAWVDEEAERIAGEPWTLVGFTCMFDQTIASLALAKAIRTRAPDKMIALGGYAVKSPTAVMLINSCPWIDAVCDGEGEFVIAALAEASVGKLPLAEVPGIVYRGAKKTPMTTRAPPAVDLNKQPVPNYDDFFDDVRELSSRHQITIAPPNLPIENSRGCWWGAKHHCTFCGIRDEDLAYRYRDPGLVLQSLQQLSGRYGIRGMQFADYILPNAYFDTLLCELAKEKPPYHIFAELKANLNEERFQLLAAAGLMELQPGIESFDSNVLRKMRKGVTAAQNVHTLVMGRKHGVAILHNLLYGFPDDELSEYEKMAELIPRIAHLDPPVTCLPVQIMRWAPLQVTPERFGIPAAEHERSYDMLFSTRYLEETGFDLDDFCYLFERGFENSPALQRVYERIQAAVVSWRKVRRDRWLVSEQDEDGVLIRDKRSDDEAVYRLDADAAAVLKACSEVTSFAKIAQMFPHLSEVDGLLRRLEELGLVFVDESRVVSLVIDKTDACFSMPSDDQAAATEPTGLARRAVELEPLGSTSDVLLLVDSVRNETLS